MNIIDKLIIKYILKHKTFSNYLLRTDESNAFSKVANKAYGINLGQFNMFTRLQLEALLKVLNNKDKVLDVGCGNGRISKYISDQVGCRIKGIDFAVDAIHNANNKYSNDNVSFEVKDIRKLDSVKEEYSKIISIDSLYFFPDLKPICRSLKRLLSPNGKLIIFFTCNLNYYGKNGYNLIDNLFSDMDVKINKTDFTENAIEMWKIMETELSFRKNEFKKEGNIPLYKLKYSEAKSYLRMAERGKIKRVMYEIY